jgi:hypothetical protein
VVRDYHTPEPGSFWLSSAILDALRTSRLAPQVQVSAEAKVQAATVARHEGRREMPGRKKGKKIDG